MPRNKNERHGTSTWHKGTVADLSLKELREIIAELKASEHGSKVKTARKALRQMRERYEAEMASRSEDSED